MGGSVARYGLPQPQLQPPIMWLGAGSWPLSTEAPSARVPARQAVRPVFGPIPSSRACIEQHGLDRHACDFRDILSGTYNTVGTLEHHKLVLGANLVDLFPVHGKSARTAPLPAPRQGSAPQPHSNREKGGGSSWRRAGAILGSDLLIGPSPPPADGGGGRHAAGRAAVYAPTNRYYLGRVLLAASAVAVVGARIACVPAITTPGTPPLHLQG